MNKESDKTTVSASSSRVQKPKRVDASITIVVGVVALLLGGMGGYILRDSIESGGNAANTSTQQQGSMGGAPPQRGPGGMGGTRPNQQGADTTQNTQTDQTTSEN